MQQRRAVGQNRAVANRGRGVDDPETGGQSYREQPPAAALAGLASSVWIQQVAPDAMPYTQRNIPNGSVEVVCALGDMPRIVGPLTRPLVELLTPGATVVGVRLAPGAAPPVLGLPASEIVDRELQADALWGRDASALGEQVNSAASAEEALAKLQTHLAGRLSDGIKPDPLVVEAVEQLRWHTDDVRTLTTSLHISERQLRRRCEAAVGYGPKALHRMLRFQYFLALTQHAIAQGRAPTDDGLARLAAAAGYADQPHLTRECVSITGVTPRALLSQAEDTCTCGHDHTASFTPLLQARPRRTS